MSFDEEKGLDVFLEAPWPSILSGKAGIVKLIKEIETETGVQPTTAAQLCNSAAFGRFIQEITGKDDESNVQADSETQI